MRRLFLFIFIFYCTGLFSQDILIADIQSKKQLPYVFIAFPGKNISAYTDVNGRITLPEELDNDSVLISMLGYEDFRSTVNLLNDTVFLNPLAYELPEAAISAKSRKLQKYGFLKENKKDGLFGYSGAFSPIRIAAHIANNTKTKCTVEKLLYRYKVLNPNLQYIVRPQVYAVADDGRPGNSLLHKSEIITITEGEGILEFDCSYEGMVFPANGIFVALEIIDVTDKQGNKINITNDKYPWVYTTGYKKTFATYTSNPESLSWSEEAMGYRPMWNVSLNASFGLEVITD
jgi:hypothetical protein